MHAIERGAVLAERFEIEQRIGTGGMGEVFRARDRLSGEPVAIKIVTDGRDHRVARFAREVELLAGLVHPGIVRYVTHGVVLSGEPFLAMEWLDGEDLAARLAREPLTMSESITLARRVAEALGAAHARGIVHRDLKPSNLFLQDGQIQQVKVLDFGIAQGAGRTHLTQTGTLIGTPGYMAPEQARAEGIVDARADVFALGCVLFTCLTGRPAFPGDTAAAVLGKILFGEAPRVSALWPAVPEELDGLVAQMLAKNPAQRPGDGANLAAALAALGPLLHGAAVAPRGAVRPAAITGRERRLVSVVLLGPSADGGEPDAEALKRAVQPWGGRLEWLADGSVIMVLDGERRVATDQAMQAARCALALRAVAAGRPLAVAMGHADPASTLPAGHVIDRAGGLLASAAAGAGEVSPIALDEVIAGLLDARFDVSERDAGATLHGERALMQGARTLLGRPTSCVGRDWELGALSGILDECIGEPEARVAVVTAAAGMGKSRIAAELLGRVRQRAEEVAIWVGRGDSLRAGSTLDLLAQAVRGALGIAGGEPLAERRDKLRAWIAARMPADDQRRVVEFLGELVGTPCPNGEVGSTALAAARQDAMLMSEQMRRAWLDFLRAETAAHPVLIVLEDLQWGDFGTVRFIDAALRELADRPWMVLALARTEVFDVFPRLWSERQSVQQIRLKELGKKAGERLVRQVLGDRIGLATIERIVHQAEGNTFYLEELIRAVAEGNRALPETVVAMVETRLARLPIEARRVLRAASVFGEVCWDGGVAMLLGGEMSAAVVGEWLARLAQQELLVVRPESRFAGERQLAFRHALLREGAYAALTEEDRRLGHRLAGDWLEARGEGDAMVLAGHFTRGGDGARAARWYLRAAEQAFHILDLDAALARAGLGLECAPPPELRIELLGMRCAAAAQGHRVVGAAMADAEELIRTAPPGSSPWAVGMLGYHEGLLRAGRIGEVLASIARLSEVEPEPDAVGRIALTYLAGIWVLDVFGQVAEGTALADRFSAIVRVAGDREPKARFWWGIVVGLRAAYAEDDPWRGLQHSEALREIYDAIGGEQLFINLELFRGLNLWFLGALEPAERILVRIAASDEALGSASSLRRVGLAWLLADRGALAEARTLAAQLAEHGRADANPVDEGRGRWVLAEVLRLLGDLEAADRELGLALAMSTPLEQPAMLGTLAALRLAQGRAGEALTAAEQAMSRLTAIGGCGMFRASCVRLVHAEALHATGSLTAAHAAISEARFRLLSIADRIPDRAYRTSFLEAVPENARTLALARAWLGEG